VVHSNDKVGAGMVNLNQLCDDGNQKFYEVSEKHSLEVANFSISQDEI